MKKVYFKSSFKLLINVLIFVFITNISFAQSINKWFQDGKIYFKIKNEKNIYIPSNGKQVNLDDVLFLQDIKDKYQIKKIEKSFYTADDIKLQNTYKLSFDNINMVEELIKELSNNPLIEYAEHAPIYYTSYIPNDDYYVNNNVNYWLLGDANTRWHLDVINAEPAWDISKGDTNIVVAVLDNAIWTDHPDLQNKIVIQTDLGDNDSDANPPVAEYLWSHGTHCAGLIAAESDNSIGVASIGYNVSIMAIKLAEDGGTGQAMTAGFEGIVWAADNGADVISMSWGSPQYFITMQNTVNYAYNKGCVLLAAAGNNGDGAETSQNPAIPVNYVGYPAALEHVIAVASTDYDDSKSSFSEYGTWIDVCSPGGFDESGIFSVLSTTYSDAGDITSMLSGTGGGAASWGISGKYDCMQGTSMACPVASGLAGLMLSVNPNLTPEELTAIMKATCDDIDALNTAFIDSIGAGRINAATALSAVQDSMLTSPLTADFEASTISIPEGGTVDFTDLSIGSPTSWDWTFEGGIPATSTDQNPLSIQYDIAGVFSVTLEISDGTNSDIEVKTYFIIVGATSGANSAWLTQATGFTTQFRGILDMSIVDPLTAWAVTYDGTAGTMTKDFAKTIDGGNTWVPGLIDAASNHDIANVSAINDQTAWVAMYDANGGGGIYKTTDGGTNWTNQDTTMYTDAASFTNVVHFFNANDGFCMGDPINNEFEIYTTTDGGTTWTLVDGANIPDPESGEMGWTAVYDAVGDIAWFGSNTGRVFKTTDKGATWSVFDTGEDNVSEISMHDNTNGILIAAVYDQTNGSLISWAMMKTNDGGEIWTTVNPVGPYYKSDMAAVPGVPGKIISTGVSQDPTECGSAYSLDYGDTWTMLDDSIQYTMVDFYDDTTGWAGGFNLSETIEGIWKWIGIPITDAPIFTSIPLLTILVDSNYVYNVTATDPNQLALNFDATILPTWLTFTQLTDSTAILSGTPNSTHVGFHDVELTADNGFYSSSQPFTIEVLSGVPYFTSLPVASFIYVGDTVNYAITAEDNNGTILTFGYDEIQTFTTLTDHGNNTATLYGIADSAGYKHYDIWITDAIDTVHQAWTQLVKPVSGINDISLASSINIFPNPSSGYLNIKYNCDLANDKMIINIYDIMGKTINVYKYENINGAFNKTLDLTKLSKGIYIIKVETNKGTIREKIVIE